MGDKEKLLIANGNQFGYSAGHYFYCKYLRDIYNIQYLCYDRGLPKMELDGVKVDYVEFKSGKLRRLKNFTSNIIQLSKKFKPDILFIVYFNLAFIACILGSGGKKILDIRTGSLNENRLKRSLGNIYIYIQSLFFSHTIVLAESLRKLLHIPENKVLILPLGAEIFSFQNKSFSQMNLLYVGTLNNRNIHITVSALRKFINSHPELEERISYKIIGFGTAKEEERLADSIKSNNLSCIVSFIGRKNYNELGSYFDDANIGIAYIPIKDYYNFQPATKIYEYVLSGMAVLATNTNENGRIMSESIGVITEDSEEEILRAYQILLENLPKYNSELIRKSAWSSRWEEIVNRQLKPFLA